MDNQTKLNIKLTKEKNIFFEKLILILNSNKFDVINIDMIDAANKQSEFAKHYWEILFDSSKHQLFIEFIQFLDNKTIAENSVKINNIESTTQKISLLTKERIFSCLTKEASINILGYFISSCEADSFKSLFNAADSIWKAAGDKSADFNFYSKRILLMYVILLSINFYHGDESENYQDTQDFIDNELNNIVANFSNAKKNIDYINKIFTDEKTNFVINAKNFKDFIYDKITDIPILRYFC